jgi:hypothetical protein
MTRLVEIKSVGGGGEMVAGRGGDVKQKIKDYGERVAKYVPAEVLAFYTGIVQLILTKDGDIHATFRIWTFAVFGLFSWVFTPIWLGRFTKDQRVKRYNQILGTIAFGVWAYAYPAGWFKEMGLNDPVIAGILLLTFTLISGFMQPRA